MIISPNMDKVETLKIAVLLACYNRKNITVVCLERLSKICEKTTNCQIEAFLTIDGCTDGTEDAVKALNLAFPLHIQHGDGSLYWVGGTNMAWKAAIKQGGFDGYLWLNDDTILYDGVLDELLYTHNYSMEKYGKGGVYVGSTCDSKTKKFTYGGRIWTNKFLARYGYIEPNDTIQECHMANGNITFFASNVISKIGIIHQGYIHAFGDFDHTYTAFKKGYPVLVMRGFWGTCDNDHGQEGYVKFLKLFLKERIKYRNSPRGLGFKDSQLFQRHHFWYRYPFTALMGWLKILFPQIYVRLRF